MSCHGLNLFRSTASVLRTAVTSTEPTSFPALNTCTWVGAVVNAGLKVATLTSVINSAS